MKKFVCLIMLFVLTGCGAKYEINITDDGIEEQININVLVDKNASDDPLELDSDSLDFVNYIEKTSIPALENNSNSFYIKNVTNNGNLYNINLSYKYSFNNYENSRVVNECFENHEIKENNGEVYIHLSGKFNCYDGEEIDIAVKSEKNIKKSNGKKEGSTYHWTINEDNYNDVDIMIETSNVSKTRKTIYIVILVVVGIGLALFLMNFFGNILGRDNANDI